METIPSQIVHEHIPDKDLLDLIAMSKDLGCTYTGLWYYVNEKRKYPAITWLKILKALGALKFDDDSIIIRTRHAKRIRKQMKFIKDSGYHR